MVPIKTKKGLFVAPAFRSIFNYTKYSTILRLQYWYAIIRQGISKPTISGHVKNEGGGGHSVSGVSEHQLELYGR